MVAPGGDSPQGHAVGRGLEGLEGGERGLQIQPERQHAGHGGTKHEVDGTGDAGGLHLAASAWGFEGYGRAVKGDGASHSHVGGRVAAKG